MKEIFSFLEKCLDLLTDKTRRPIHKFSWAIALVLIAFLFNDYAGCTFFLGNNAKLSQLEKIDGILKDTSLPSDIRNGLVNLRQETFYRRSFLLSIIKNISSSTSKEIIINKANNTITTISVNFYWEVISSAWLFLVAICILPFRTTVITVGKYRVLKKIAYILIVETILLLISLFIAFLFSRIPIIDDNPAFNYLVNFSVTLVIIIAIGLLVNRKPKEALKK